jgi:plasmid replication initiation protein
MNIPDTPNPNLMPVRHPQGDLFICDVADAVLKDVIDQLEYPFYSLSKKPETTVRRYEHNGNWVEVVPSVKGMATIYDKDILIYAISQIMAKLNRNEPVARRVRINTRELLQFTNRGTGGKDYQAICESLERLDGTRIRTNIRRGDEEHFNAFGLVESASVARQFGLDGRLLWAELTLSDWVFDAIRAKQVLTLHPDYFRLRKPIERRVYELARKHCGQDASKVLNVSTLYRKSGSKGHIDKFRYVLKGLADSDHLPDYALEYDQGKNQITFLNRNTMPLEREKPDQDASSILARLSPDVREKARHVAPGWDVDYLKGCFASWWFKLGKFETGNADALFLKFCRTWYERNGAP